MPKPKVLFWDIEASNLNANYGFVFCVGYKWQGEKKVHVIDIRDFKSFKKDTTDDKEVLKAFEEVYNSADVTVAHYGQRFDLPFIQTRRMMQSLGPMANVPMIDTWRISKYKLKLNSNRLETISRSIPTNKDFKTPVEGHHWVKGAAGNDKSIQYIVDHCIADIKVLEKVFDTIAPLATGTPNLSKLFHGDIEGCPMCASKNTHKRGLYLTGRGKKQRRYCSDCGHWFTTTAKDILS